MKALCVLALLILPLAAREPLAQRIVHTDPSKYRPSKAVHEGAGDWSQEDVGQRRRQEDETGGERRVRDVEGQDAEGQLVQAIPEQTDRLRGPIGGESGVERQPDEGMAADT